MKLSSLALSGLLALATIHPAHADDWLSAKKGATAFGATAAGVALGGPLGMIGGALIGAWMNNTLDEASTAEDTRDQLEPEMLFKTNPRSLTTTGQQRLADFLIANPAIEIRLDGYADPRGEDSDNKQLSLGRVNHVAEALEDFGVDTRRIESFSHGASVSSAAQGDYDAYALERAVKINLSQPPASGYARVD